MEIKTILIILLLIGFLLTSLALNYVFYKKAFMPLHALRLDPMELSYYPSSISAEEVNNKKKKVMFYGDSRSLAWPYPNSNSNSSPSNDHYYFLNRAIGNQSSLQILSRFQEHVNPHHPEIMIIQMGVNDLKMIPLFPDRKNQIIEDCKENIQKLIQQAHETKAKVILTTIFPLGDVSLARSLLGIKEQPIIEAIDEVNQFIKTLENEKTVIFDTYSLLLGEDRKITPRYSHDWLHLNVAGYQHLNESLERLMKSL